MIMYACDNCFQHNSEACAYVDPAEVRVMPSGEWLCNDCYDEITPEDSAHWSSLLPPAAYVVAGDVGQSQQEKS